MCCAGRDSGAFCNCQIPLPCCGLSLQTQSNGTFNGKLFLITRRVCATTSSPNFFASTDMLQGSPKFHAGNVHTLFCGELELRQRYLTLYEGLNFEL